MAPRQLFCRRRGGWLALATVLLAALAAMVLPTTVRRLPATVVDAAQGPEAPGALLFRSPGHSRGTCIVGISADGRWGISGSEDGVVILWDLAGQRAARRWAGHLAGVLALAFTGDSTHCSSAGRDGTIRLWNCRTGEAEGVLRGHNSWVTGLAFLPEGDLLSSSFDRTLRRWDTHTGREIGRWNAAPYGATSLAVSGDGRVAIAGGFRRLYLWDPHKSEQPAGMPAEEGWVFAVAISRDGRQALSGGYDRCVKLWSLPQAKEIRRFAGHADSVLRVAFLPGGRAFSSGEDRIAQLWDCGSGAPLSRRPAGVQFATSALPFADGTRIFYGAWNGEVSLARLP